MFCGLTRIAPPHGLSMSAMPSAVISSRAIHSQVESDEALTRVVLERTLRGFLEDHTLAFARRLQAVQ